jgi:membrane protein implicated in regulation of membrane protease activity
MEAVKPWMLWALLAAVLTMVEVATVTLVFLMLAAGAAAAAIAAGVGANPVVQLVAFSAVSVGSLALVRPIAYRRLHSGVEYRTGAAALVGQQATVVEHVDGHNGRVRIGGEIWTARSYDGHSEYEVGSRVDVAQIEGATALVL